MSSHILILGYGGEVTTKSMELSLVESMFCDGPMKMECLVVMSNDVVKFLKTASVREIFF